MTQGLEINVIFASTEKLFCHVIICICTQSILGWREFKFVQMKGPIHHQFFLWQINYYYRLTMSFMRMPLAHSAASESSSGKSELPEGTTFTWEVNSCHRGRCSLLLSIYVYALLYVYFVLVEIDHFFRFLLIFIWSPPWYWSIDRQFDYLSIFGFFYFFFCFGIQRWDFRLFYYMNSSGLVWLYACTVMVIPLFSN